MTRQEEITQAADKDFEIESVDMRDDLDFYKVYRAGVIYRENHPISPWISVEDDLPCNHEELVHSNYTDRVLVLSRNGYFEIAFMCIIEDIWEWNTLITVLYWMPIPKLPKE